MKKRKAKSAKRKIIAKNLKLNQKSEYSRLFTEEVVLKGKS